MNQTWIEFESRVRGLLEPTAVTKGYSTTGVDGKNALYEFVQGVADGPGHALGEIIYKATRYGAKRHPEDLEKIAAWAFLAWRHHQHHEADVPAMAVIAPCEGMTEIPHGDGFGYAVQQSAKMGRPK